MGTSLAPALSTLALLSPLTLGPLVAVGWAVTAGRGVVCGPLPCSRAREMEKAGNL